MTDGGASGRSAIWPGGRPENPMPYSPGIKAGPWVFVSGQLASDFVDGVPAEAEPDPGSPFLQSRLELQSRYVMKQIATILEAGGCDLRRDVVRSYQWLPSPRPTYEEFVAGSSTTDVRVNDYLMVFNESIDEPRPASTAMGVRRLLTPGTLLEVDMIALDPSASTPRHVNDLPPDVPQPVAKYSASLSCGDWVFLAGDLATDFRGDFGSDVDLGDRSGIAPEARRNSYFWYGSSIEAQTEYLLAKLEKVARASGTSFDRAVKFDVYIGHPQDLVGIERVWRRWFPENPPARMIIPYCGLAARGCRIEIAVQFLAGDSPLTIERIETSDAPEPVLHEPQAVKAGDLVFLSTQMPVDSSGRIPARLQRSRAFPWHGQPSQWQMRYMLENVSAICEAAGTKLENVCRRQAFHDDFERFAPSIDEWISHFPVDPPASTTIEVGGPLLVPGVHAMLDLIAYAP